MNVEICSSLGVFDWNGSAFRSELTLKEGEDETFELGLQNGKDKLGDFIRESKSDMLGLESLKREKLQNPKVRRFEDKGGRKSEDLTGIEMARVRN